ncbi:SDR family oxidoreductase [Rhodococcus sp. NPDC057529]|uniref:SDR family oxidoreductase n=1 Tax=Rhodococcus sp. NPDC057529 TaxID=3346158 RepID=UPI0036728875
MGRVQDKIVIVTGGARGMGAEHARLLISEGARVVIGDILDDPGRALAAELGDTARFYHLDVASPSDWDDIVAYTIAEFGGVDVLVNNAGITLWGGIDTLGLEQWHRMMDIDVTGPFLGMRACAAELKKSTRNPSIVNVSSIAGLIGYSDLVGYVSAKWAVRGMTKAAALDLAPFGIRVNSVHPGVIETPAATDLAAARKHRNPMGRPGRAEEVSRLVLFLAGDESSFSNGAEFVADGGDTVGFHQIRVAV